MCSTNYSVDDYFCVGSKKRMKKLSRRLQTGTRRVATALTEPFTLYALSLNRWIPLVSQMEAGEHHTQNAKCFPLHTRSLSGRQTRCILSHFMAKEGRQKQLNGWVVKTWLLNLGQKEKEMNERLILIIVADNYAWGSCELLAELLDADVK